MTKSMSIILCIAAVLVLNGVSAFAEKDPAESFKLLFGDDAKKVAATADKKDDAVFAATMLKDIKGVEGQPKLKMYVYDQAYQFALKGHAWQTAHEAVSAQAEAEPGRKTEWDLKRLEVRKLRYAYSRGEEKKKVADSYITQLMVVGDAEIAADKIDEGIGRYLQAFTIARATQNPRTDQITAKYAKLQELKKRQRKFDMLLDQLKKNPGDKAIREEVIMEYVLGRDDPEGAAKYLKGLDDDLFVTCVTEAAKSPESVTEDSCLELGKWYQKLAADAGESEKGVANRRAATYYTRYLALHTNKDIMRLKIERELAKLEKVTWKTTTSTGNTAVSIAVKGAVLAMSFDRSTFKQQGGKQIVQDLSGRGHHGVVKGCKIVPGRFGEALKFNGIRDFVSLRNPAALNFMGKISIAAWINPKSTSGAINILAHGYARKPKAEVFLKIHDGQYSVGTWDGTGHSTRCTIPGDDVGKWVHLCGVYDGNKWILYRNGVQVSSVPDITGAIRVNANWAIGAKGDGSERFFSGMIDEVYIFNRALTQEEIVKLAKGK